MGLLDRIATRKGEPEQPAAGAAPEQTFGSKALGKFLWAVTSCESPVLLDLGPVVGGNVSFFGEHLGCKIMIEDICADLDRHIRSDTLDAFPEFLAKRFSQASGSVSGILCWDVIDYLDRPAQQLLAEQLMRILAPEGALLGLFATVPMPENIYSKYIIADDVNLKQRSYPAERGRQSVLLNRDIIRLFGDLRVSDSFLLKNNFREILFRKPSA